MEPLAGGPADAPAVAILCQDGLDFDEALRFNERRLTAGSPWLWASCAAMSRGYVGPFAAEPATSWATPHLAGIAARLLSLRPGLKPFEVKTLLYWLSRNPSQG